ncbi:MAG: hypothetical protein AAB426_08215 [Myxococcota bacterium]
MQSWPGSVRKLARHLCTLVVLVTPGMAEAQWTMTLTLEGGSDDGATTTLGNVVPTISAEAAFGVVNTLYGTQGVGEGERVRLETGGPGSHFVATIVATVAFVAGLDCPVTPADCVPMGQQANVDFYQVPVSFTAARIRYANGTAASWTAEGAGSQVPESQSTLQAGVNNGGQVTHQIAVLVLDSDLAGAKTTELHYVAVAIP